ncbi:MAG: FMN-binding protein, partial [Clostridia bacterium]|nr:FMN-binding protein [Clostridia bacterium]
AITVTCKETGEPSAITGVEYVTGATQSSGRLILAIQNAVKFHGEKTVTGEYKYVNAYGDGSTFYGASVSLTVENGVITAATLAADTETMFNLSANWTVDYTITGEPTEGKKAWMDKGEDFVQSFVGKTVEEVMAITVTCKETGEPSAITGVEYVTGATQSSGRVILAVQNALSK